MKTIVINTSKAVENTHLNVLFKTPFDESSLIWFDKNLNELHQTACDIKNSLINDTDKIDRDYNLIVLVDLFGFAYSKEQAAANLYKALITEYVAVTLVSKLANNFALIPEESAVYFLDSAKNENEFDPNTLTYSNPTEQNQDEQSRLHEIVFTDTPEDDTSELVDNLRYQAPKTTSFTNTQKLIMKLFGWNEQLTAEQIEWKLKSAAAESEYLADLSEVFSASKESIRKAGSTANALLTALMDVENKLSETKANGWDAAVFESLVPQVLKPNYKIKSLTCRFCRDNEQSLIESLFGLFSNVFTCVQNAAISDTVKEYDAKCIEKLLSSALKKYRYFSDEKHMTVEFDPISQLFKKREKIFSKWKNLYESETNYSSPFHGKSAKDIPSFIRNACKDKKGPNSMRDEAEKMTGFDRSFHTLVADIYDNYDEQLIHAENEYLLQTLLKDFWNWRDTQTNNSFRKIVKDELSEIKQSEETLRDFDTDSSFIIEELESEYVTILNDITDAAHQMTTNKNILLETKNVMIRYMDLMNKGKRWLISLVGAVIAVAASVLPYIAILSSSNNENIIHRILYIVFTAGFAALYGLASYVYIHKINSKKKLLIEELTALKEKSEKNRCERIAALYEFYTTSVQKAENHYLLSRELSRIEHENSKKSIQRNTHKNQLKKMEERVRRYMTLLKMVTENDKEDKYALTPEDEKQFDSELRLTVTEPFHSPENFKVYSILSPDFNAEADQISEGGEQ